jgi:Zn-dependent protease
MLPAYALVCGRCGALAHRAELERLTQEAMSLEPHDPTSAALRWRRCLELLPTDSQQYAAVFYRLNALTPGFAVSPPAYAAAPELPPREDSVADVLLKTGGSMLLSILVYAVVLSPGSLVGGLVVATGFVVLILVHELGHVAAMRYYGLSASPPIFIPFLGALINLRQPPRNAKEEAVVGIGGPIAGTVAALVVYVLYLKMPADTDGAKVTYLLAFAGFVLNLFNLLPVPPLDGGRITAAISPKVWLLGIAGLIGLMAYNYVTNHRVPWLLLVVLLFAIPRVKATLGRGRDDRDPYYAISRRASRTIAALYVALGVLLIVMFLLTRDAMNLA